MGTLIRCLVLAFGILAAVPLLVVLFLLPKTPITVVGALYLLGCILIACGMISVLWWRHFSALILLGTSLILATLALRIVFPPSGSRLVLTTFPSQSEPRCGIASSMSRMSFFLARAWRPPWGLSPRPRTMASSRRLLRRMARCRE